MQNATSKICNADVLPGSYIITIVIELTTCMFVSRPTASMCYLNWPIGRVFADDDTAANI